MSRGPVPGVARLASRLVFAGLDQAGGELVEQVGLLDQIAAGLGQWGEASTSLFRPPLVVVAAPTLPVCCSATFVWNSLRHPSVNSGMARPIRSQFGVGTFFGQGLQERPHGLSQQIGRGPRQNPAAARTVSPFLGLLLESRPALRPPPAPQVVSHQTQDSARSRRGRARRWRAGSAAARG